MPALPPERPSERSLAAAGLLLAGIVCASFNGALMKAMAEGMPVMMLIWGRYFGYLAFMLPIALVQHGTAVFTPPRMRLQLVRVAILVTATVLFVSAMLRMPYADAVAVFYAYPFLVVALSPAMLGEPADRLTWIGVACGFCGVLVVMRPGLGGDLAGGALALLAGLLTALFVLLTRLLARGGDAVILSTFTAIASVALLTVALPFAWRTPDLVQLGGFALLGAATALAHWLSALAYGRATATLLAPITYCEIVVAVVFGFLFFGDWPDATGWAGMLVIVAGGVLVARARAFGARPSRPRAEGAGGRTEG